MNWAHEQEEYNLSILIKEIHANKGKCKFPMPDRYKKAK
jgi:hypothetical protein